MSTSKPTLRDRQRELTRESIFGAAIEAFGDKGYNAVTVDDIVRHAGISRATFYLHFDGKASVLRALRERRLLDWSTDDNPHWGSGERESIHAFFEKMVTFYNETPILYRSLHEARAADPEFAAEHRKLLDQQVEQAIAGDWGVEVDQARIRLMIMMMYTMLDYFMYLWLIQGWKVEREAAIDAMTDALYAVMH